MASSLFKNQTNKINPQMQNKIKSIAGMLKGNSNPMTMLGNMVGNDKVNNILNMVGNGNPKDVFYQKCKEMNVDPNDIINLLK